jgi:hypothetical protein
MALRIGVVCVADHNKDTCGLSFRLTPTDRATNETVHYGALQLARVFCDRHEDFCKVFRVNGQ